MISLQECFGTLAIQVSVVKIRDEPFYFACSNCKKKNAEVCGFVFACFAFEPAYVTGRNCLHFVRQEPPELAPAPQHDRA